MWIKRFRRKSRSLDPICAIVSNVKYSLRYPNRAFCNLRVLYHAAYMYLGLPACGMHFQVFSSNQPEGGGGVLFFLGA